jgi:hydrogenase-1 operon protein HyaF
MPGPEESGVTRVHLQGNGNARELLNQIVQLLQNLLEKEEAGSIDISQLPLGDEDYDLLDDVLGEGEVHADVNTLGATQIYETGVPGVWWVTHFDADDEVMAEFIEVTYCPDILVSAREDIRDGVDALQARLLAEHLSSRGEEHGS